MIVRPIRSIAVALAIFASATTHAQGAARSQDIDASIRSIGMGGANVAVGWGEPGVWGNPASLARTTGIQWIRARTRLAPGLADHVILVNDRVLLGAAGLGVALGGKPFDGLGFTHLDYGPPGTSAASEHTNSVAFAVSPLRVLGALQVAGSAALLERFEFSLGMNSKSTRVELVPGSGSSADGRDWGLQGRVALLPPDRHTTCDLSAGYAVLGANEQIFAFGSSLAPGSRIRRSGVALHAVKRPDANADRAMPWWLAGVERSIGVGLAFDHEAIGTLDQIDYRVDHFGLEVTLLGVLSGRTGYWADKVGQINDFTYGAGIRLPVGRAAAVGFDWASRPQADDSGLPNVNHMAVTVALNPLELVSKNR